MKAVITCAGMGNRLLPFTKELPKEMSPIFIKNGSLQVKPILQQIFEDLFSNGIRNFCFVTGRTKRSIEDHFTPASSEESKKIPNFYKMLLDSTVMWVNQLEPKGFGHAVLVSKPYVANESFLVQAGDSIIISNSEHPLNHLISLENKHEIDAGFLIRKVDDPKRHGIVTIKEEGQYFKVTKAVEKPDKPDSSWGIMPLYFFRKSIFDALEKIKPGFNNEIQLTDGIQELIDSGKKVVAIPISDDIVIDVGTPESYWQALSDTHSIASR